MQNEKNLRKTIKKILKSEQDNKMFIILQYIMTIAFVCLILLYRLQESFVSQIVYGRRYITDEASYKGVGMFIVGVYIIIAVLTVLCVKNSAYSAAIHDKNISIVPLNNVETFSYGTTEYAKGIDKYLEAHEGAICKKCLTDYKNGNYNKVYYVGIKTDKTEVNKIVFLSVENTF